VGAVPELPRDGVREEVAGLKILLVDLGGKMPNLALMKLSAWHKARGDEVRLVRNPPAVPIEFWWADRAYVSCVFTSYAPLARRMAAHNPPKEVVLGGYGLGPSSLPAEVEHTMPDYDLYGCDFSMGFTSRGCVRRCPWCVVPEMEGPIRDHAPITEFLHPSHDKVILLDNNFLASPRWRQNLQFLIDHGIKVNFNQGLDIRLVDEEVAGTLADCRYYDWKFQKRRLHFAFDTPEIEAEVRRGVEILKAAGIPPRRLMFYVLVGFGRGYRWEEHRGEVFRRLRVLLELGVDPFVMVWNNRRDIPELRRLARWVNKRIYAAEPDFDGYDPSVGHGRGGRQ
jgi:hypothetical protein